jgi:hypothetical protein
MREGLLNDPGPFARVPIDVVGQYQHIDPLQDLLIFVFVQRPVDQFELDAETLRGFFEHAHQSLRPRGMHDCADRRNIAMLGPRLHIKRLKSTQDRCETVEAFLAPRLAEIADSQ